MTNKGITRREFLGGLAATGALASISSGGSEPPNIDRFALVSRHNPVLHKFDPMSPLSVGNGEFAFTCDVTGLQTFSELYKDAMPLCTMSQWGWHTTPLPEHLKGKELRLTNYDTHGRQVGYMTGSDGQKELFDWLRENPHRLHLGQIGFRLLKNDYRTEASVSDVSNIYQKLNLWNGTITSKFRFEGRDVGVTTAVHPTLDLIAVQLGSWGIAAGNIQIRFSFPYGSSSVAATDWQQSGKHLTAEIRRSKNGVSLRRSLDNEEHYVQIAWSGSASFALEKPHQYLLFPESRETMDFVILFSRKPQPPRIPSVSETFNACERQWQSFWTTGAAIDLSNTKDPRGKELERRIVLSQYLTKINCSGSMPPQETGLTCNSWYGKFHLEMHWWHAAHFALWNRFPLLERSLDYYQEILPSARERAKQQGYTGARWPKMTSPDGRDSPSPIGPLLIWQQPHPIFYAELAYLTNPTLATLKKYQAVVFESAEFMASYAYFDKAKSRYVLGPPVIPAQENHPPRETWNPTFELEYWHFGMTTAQKWRERLKLARDPKWDDVIKTLSPLPAKDGVYLAHENSPQTFTERNKDHPSMLGALGILSGEKVDRETMRRTLKKVMKEWDWAETWGWDYPMTAMTATRLGEPEMAINALLLDTPKNHYLPNGHNYQRPNLPLYLPGNGGLLYAVALMANGWKGSPKTGAPGFPSSWKVRAEGFNKSIFGMV